MTPSETLQGKKLTGRNRRLFYEWDKLYTVCQRHQEITLNIEHTNALGLPTTYLVEYNIRSICGVQAIDRLGEVGVENTPVFATGYTLSIELPDAYPCIDAQPVFQFLTKDKDGNAIPHPWHPNIRYFGDLAGRVCLNMLDTSADLAWGVERIADYLAYNLYNAMPEPPYPEDLRVAEWVRHQGEPKNWIFFNQQD